MGRTPKVLFAIDDYGMTPLTCERIEQCLTFGAANKISVFPNSELSDLPLRLGRLEHTDFCVHLNLVEGKCVSDKKDVPLLTDSDGYFSNSFFGLLALSLSEKKEEFSRQVYAEIRAQILRAVSFFPEGTPLYLDSHQHTHMIPAVFHALLQVVQDLKVDVKYIRIPAEPVTPYLLTPSLYPQYCSVNFIKHWVLKCCHLFNRSSLAASGIPTALFCGIMFSGNMNYERVAKILPKYRRLAEKKQCDIEFLFHSGYTDPGEPLFDERKVSFHPFYYSQGRRNEYDALMKLKEDC